MLKKNMHSADRFIRIAAGITLIHIGFIDAGWAANAIIPLLLGVIGFANFVFAFSGFCPLYALAGYNFANQENTD